MKMGGGGTRSEIACAKAGAEQTTTARVIPIARKRIVGLLFVALLVALLIVDLLMVALLMVALL